MSHRVTHNSYNLRRGGKVTVKFLYFSANSGGVPLRTPRLKALRQAQQQKPLTAEHAEKKNAEFAEKIQFTGCYATFPSSADGP